MPSKFLRFSATDPAFAWFFWGSLCFSLLYARAGRRDRPQRALDALVWILAGTALFCVLRPGREAAHYLQILVVPMGLLVGRSLAAATAEADTAAPRTLARVLPVVLLVLVALVPQMVYRAESRQRFVGYFAEHRAAQPGPAARYVREHAGPDDTLAIWGWDTEFLVETGLPHATREAHTSNQLSVWSMQDYYRNRFVWDLERAAPAWFVDVVGPDAFLFDRRDLYGHEVVPKLNEVIVRDYELRAEIAGKRIYHRKASR